MKRAFSFAAIVTTLSLTGCADLQQQASSYMPGSQPAQPTTAGYEGGQQVQFIPGNAKTSTTSYQANNTNASGQQDSSFMGDMMKTATDSVKSEAGSSVRSVVRGLFSR
ncbi:MULTISPECIES: hypothetical protein [Pseudomonas syringae group]|uniref:hypothetical protein n=1 Tax=Pseudomonas syringae group TaxID=136849 RepID=UPI0009B00588|nr:MULTISPECIES: hypothetical protein [Pseudomonas syringae group]ARA80353.1 hypothetical protein B5U27_09920 [Pseudomonas amygdali pv. lachrymans]MCK9715186.1 hypothetical protein [Pseudomonas syringae pv. syringae]MCK9764267.1 hypothetical protein [Pseudomonas syringae pv. syringae]